MKNVVIFCGGRGAQDLIKSMAGHHQLNLIVNAYDDGHSTGRLRELFGILGPSDCRKNCEYLLDSKIDNQIKQFFAIRFDYCSTTAEVIVALNSVSLQLESISLDGESSEISIWMRTSIEEISQELMKFPENTILEDCSLMNLLLVNEVLKAGSFQKGVDAFVSAFKINDQIILNSEENLALVALTRSGHILFSEGEIVEGRSSEIIDELYLVPYSDYGRIKKQIDSIHNYYEKADVLRKNHVFPSIDAKTKKIISNADIIIYAAGTANSSLYPTYLTKGLAEAISESYAKKIMLVNIGADYETPDYKASDFVKRALNFLNSSIDNIPAYTNSSRLIDTVFVNQPVAIERHHIVFDYKDPIFSLVNVVSNNFENPIAHGRHTKKFFEEFNKIIFK